MIPKLKSTAAALIISFAASVTDAKLLSNDLIWDFNLFADPTSQGWYFENFKQIAVDPDKGTVRLEIDGKQQKPLPEIVQPSYFKSFVPAEDFDALEIRMKVEVFPTKTANSLKLRMKWQRNGEKVGGELELPLVADREFRVYKFALAQAKGWAGKNDYVRVSLFPICSTGIDSVRMDIDYIKFVPTTAAALREKSELVDTRLTGAELLAKGLERRGIKVPGVTAELTLLRQEYLRINSTKNDHADQKITLLNRLEKPFSSIYRRLECGRRLEMLNESATAIVKSIEFREKHGETVPTATVRKSEHLRQELIRLSQLIAKGAFDAATTKLDETEKYQLSLWNELCAANGKSPAWQLGISNTSFGRYGWTVKHTSLTFQGNGKDFISRGGYFTCANGFNQTLKFSPVGAGNVSERKVNEVTWVSADWEYTYKTQAGKKLKWGFKNSMLAPGILLETDAAEVSFAINTGKDSSPTKILAPTRKGLKILPFSSNITKIDLTENWLLLLCDDNYPAAPWLLTFQKRPDSFKWTPESLIIRRTAGLGIIGISNPWGIRPLPIGFSRNWTTPPDDAVKQCRRIAAIMTCYPYKCDEYFTIDKANGTIAVTEMVSHFQIVNDWNAKGEKIAPLPPVLAFAMDNGYPAKRPKTMIDCNMPTIYGPYLAQSGTQLEYTLPIPDLRNPTPLRTDAFPQWQKEANDLVKTFWPLKQEFNGPSRSPVSGSHAVFLSWSLLDEKSRQSLAENCRASICTYFDIQAKLGTFEAGNGRGTTERAEPFTGLPYQVYGWTVVRNGLRVYGDISNFSGFKLYLFYLYAKYTGDWNLIRDNWVKLQRIFEVCTRTCDWAVMGQSCMEDYFLHSIDMGPDSWCAPVAMTGMAEVIGDRRTADLALYMATKQAVPLVTAFNKRKWDTQYNSRWNEKENEKMPETGYTDSGYVGGDWKRTGFDYNFIIGCMLSPECINLYRDFCPDAATTFEYDLLERFYPQWRDAKFTRYGKNSPGPITRHLLLREALGESTEKLAEIVRGGLLEGTGENIGKYLEMGGLPWLKSASAAILIGRDAPCQLADWAPARLQNAEFDAKTKKVSVQFNSPTSFVIRIISRVRPLSVTMNAQPLTSEEWTYDAARHDLRIPVKKTGLVTLILDYPGWTRPTRKPIVVPRQNTVVSQEMTICMNERERRKSSTIQVDSYQTGDTEPLDLSPCLNMNLAAASGNQGWLGIALQPGQKVQGSGASELPKGLQLFCGVPFVIADMKKTPGKGAIGLFGGNTADYPRKISIRLGKSYKKLYFLHVANNAGPTGTELIRYLIRYADGTSATFRSRSQQEIGNWSTPEKLPMAKLVSVPENGQKRGVYVTAWENNQYEEIAVQNADVMQRPIRKIATVEIESTGKAGALAVLAITGEMP